MGDKLTKLQEEHMASFAPLSRVVVTGGTHGDELAGVYLVQKGLVKQPEFLHRETFTAQAIVANPEASRKSCRFVDTDLNRCFTFESLSSSTANSSSYEIRRAKELNHLLGPKGSNEAVDFICDLHTTTANMGTCIIVDSEKDYLSCQAAHYLKEVSTHPCRILLMKSGTPTFSMMSLAKHYLTLEIGPAPHGVIRADIYNTMKMLVGHLLDFIDQFNKGQEFPAFNMDCFQIERKFDYPRDEEGQLTACIHPKLQDSDFKPLFQGDPIFQSFVSEDSICYEAQDPICPIFINEASYYSKGIAFWGTKIQTFEIASIKVSI
ncbi:N-acyl-aromatic-L-amino acid amidohydrolase (carboxylate-forming)-like isoform X1 [Polypterus senegalus]|uniref:N-acyl-aromatic-L-amino acid amidohydrolase (carboxylate-forming)-like isoform X1 n=1 Tax=Polypterus senegalus TaxID=55291 RepID=UPI001965CF31|nr:N-acyl-aromatic-L-amino acid amidohydrolase (carboxylate-forming)-like isoform X1 [Polypterus senegalus]XP_039623580.1 N-acyl-aromatic-L-amino acid amidohydrolase (carboxylate-forming)-like isoform X1 [Polypterus senegalus]